MHWWNHTTIGNLPLDLPFLLNLKHSPLWHWEQTAIKTLWTHNSSISVNYSLLISSAEKTLTSQAKQQGLSAPLGQGAGVTKTPSPCVALIYQVHACQHFKTRLSVFDWLVVGIFNYMLLSLYYPNCHQWIETIHCCLEAIVRILSLREIWAASSPPSYGPMTNQSKILPQFTHSGEPLNSLRK